MKPDPFDCRWALHQERLRETHRAREAQVDRWLGWIFTAAFFVLLVIVALGAAAARWLWIHAS